MTPTFSIIIPVYNVAPYLRECLDSVLAQTVNDPASSSYAAASWEAICVDDGSTDLSGKILDEYAKSDSRFAVIHQTNSGVGGARNRAIKKAKGGWIVFLDADDVLAECTLQALSREVLCGSAELLMFGYQDLVPGRRTIISVGDVGWKDIDVSSTIPAKVVDANMWQFAIQRLLSENVCFKDYAHGEDRLFMGEVLKKVRRVRMSETALYSYRTREGSAINSVMSPRVLGDEFRWRFDFIKVFEQAHMRLPPCVWHNLAVSLSEGYVESLNSLCSVDKDSRLLLQRLLWDSCSYLKGIKGFSYWFRIAFQILGALRSPIVDYILCVVPRKLKMFGFHR